MAVFVVVILTVAVAVALPMPVFVGATLRQKWRQPRFHLQAALAQQSGQNRVVQQDQLVGLQLQGDVSVAQVVGGLQQRQRP